MIPDSVPDPPRSPLPVLPVLPFWHARSFWLTVLALVSAIAPALGINATWASNPATIDAIMHIAGGIAAALAWKERLAPSFRLGWPK